MESRADPICVSGQTAAIVPFEVAGQILTNVQFRSTVFYQPVTVYVNDSRPGIFTKTQRRRGGPF